MGPGKPESQILVKSVQSHYRVVDITSNSEDIFVIELL